MGFDAFVSILLILHAINEQKKDSRAFQEQEQTLYFEKQNSVNSSIFLISISESSTMELSA
jgi:hypothetical protein